MPSVGSVTIPDLKAPRVSLPRLGDVAGRSEPDAPLDADELRASTAAIIARWRKSMGLRAAELSASEPKEAPITTLVDIVDEERELHEDDEPINAVLDILRGARTSTAEPHEQSTLG